MRIFDPAYIIFRNSYLAARRFLCLRGRGTMIGKIQRVPLRDVWKHEALELTRWLEANIDVISEQIGTTLSTVERKGCR